LVGRADFDELSRVASLPFRKRFDMTRRRPARIKCFASLRARGRPTIAFFLAAWPAISLLIIAFGIAAPTRVLAEPGYVSLKDALAASETIAIARVVDLPPHHPHFGEGRPTKATIDLVRVLKGNLKPGKQEVRLEDYPRGANGEFVVFLDKNRVWKFTARSRLPGGNIESNVLTMLGCDDDDDGWFVEPSLITLQQIKTYLKDGSLRYSIEGPIWFPQRLNPTWKASAICLKLTYDAIKKEAHVAGLPKVTGFRSKPTVSIDHHRCVSVEYSSDSDRSLKLLGHVDSLEQKAGSMLARFVVDAPDALSAEALQKYLADEQLGRMYYKLRLHCARSQKYPKLTDLLVTLDEHPGEIATIAGWDGGSLFGDQIRPPGPFSLTPNVVGGGEKPVANDSVFRILAHFRSNQNVMLTFDIGKPPDLLRFTSKNVLISHIFSTPTRGTIELHDGKRWHRITTFTAELEPVQFGLSAN
jgi:hypothetical protein